ncbi:MAG: putative NRPS-like protein biosynthetic cluster [Bogoriella megaspora]|nr:MAG: putative NRPS-like protein biosynthetic cluster [Bogoriella megaspora]
MSKAHGPHPDIPSAFSIDRARQDRLVHLIPDELAELVPDHPIFAYPKTELPKDGFVDVSAKKLANAINRTAWYLEEVLGKNPEGFPTIGYIGFSDIRYFLFFFGAIKAGYKMLFLSPRNSVEGHLNVLEKSECHTYLVAKGYHFDHVLKEREMKTAIVPELDELLDEAEVPKYPYDKDFEQAQSDPCLVLHTTGSTGLPKPITWKNAILSTYEGWRTIPAIDDYVPMTEIYAEASRAYNAMPLFHTSGLNIGITMSFILGVTTVYPAAKASANPAYVDEMHKYAKVDASIGPPTTYEELSHDPVSLDRVNKMHWILVCGAPLSQTAGDVIAEHTRVISNFGATETACLPRLAPPPEDWAYFYWHPSHSGIELREAIEGLFELFLVKDPEISKLQGIFYTFPHLDEYSMNDLYAKHPDPNKKFLCRWKSRADDVIVLNNGENLAPAQMESSLAVSSLVKGCMVVGHGRFQPAVLVDLGKAPPTDSKELQSTVKELLPALGEANKHAPSHGKLDQYHVMFVDPERPIVYLGQGKIQRLKTFKLYEDDFEDLYQKAESLCAQQGLTLVGDMGDLPGVDFNEVPSITNWLSILISELTELKDLGNDDEFFDAGMDSLQVGKLVRELKFQAKNDKGDYLTPDVITPEVVYSHPTISELAEFLHKQAKGENEDDSAYSGSGSDSDSGSSNNNPKLDQMKKILDEQVQSLPEKSGNRTTPVTQGSTVLLTGSTGSLGSYILHELNNDKNVSHVICLDRSDNALEKHKKALPERGLGELDEKKVECLKADLSDPELGLGTQEYERVRDTVTHIIHCQWPVNFNWVISSFKPYIAGVRNICNMAATGPHNAFVLFVSSIAATERWTGEQVPETPVTDLNAAAPIGYGQSKLIAENLLDQAARKSGVRTAICRSGIVAGPVESKKGLWNKHEYIPSIIISSAYLGVFPEDFPSRDHIDWLPVDKLSKILVEILEYASEPERSQAIVDEGLPDENNNTTDLRAQMFHAVNPKASSWHKDLAADMMAEFPDGDVKAVSFDDWLKRLTKTAEDFQNSGNIDVERNPAIRLVDFYTKASKSNGGGRRILPTTESEKASKTLRELGPLQPEWLDNWMAQWGVKN